MTRPPKPRSRPEKVSLWQYMRLFRRDILSAQPEKLYRAWMAEFRTPFFRSYMVNDRDVIRAVLKDRPKAFPKSDRVGSGLRPLLGNSVFLTNGATWERQRRIIDPAFEGGRLRETFPSICRAAQDAAERFAGHMDQDIDIEPETSHAAADVIFRTLFSIPIEHAVAREVFEAFQTYQRSQPILNLAAFVPVPPWVPRGYRRETRASAARIRRLIHQLTAERQIEIDAGRAPQDLATKIMTTADPQTGERFDVDEMVDQVAIFFLAGHETSASALAWALYLLALFPDWQDRVAQEAQGADLTAFSQMSKLKATRDVFRETLRLYPPVPMMVRETTAPERFRNRDVRPGAQVVISQWHLHRQTRIWEHPDDFDPTRWDTETGQTCARDAYLPFSAGPRVCPGAGFAMLEGVMMLAHILRDLRVTLGEGPPPIPVAHLTVRSRDGIRLKVVRR
ncbi:cytochrome P450 [Roseobacter sinensis]|uniref:Cytochrome P450 n=1 Tax=Roseobacter sinensis TaxID=2931391 RepID=A0ABT3BEK0_9RHOB|nr:cytochrome P450 [Roseobacter sp. WL0113]MCV3271985.1 cytochrome P450 [Roseobacter sp. WL0113]